MLSCWNLFFRSRTIQNEEISDPCQPNLQNMPTEAMGEVLKYLDVKSIFRLRKVCRDIRSSIDLLEPELHVKSLSFELPITKKSLKTYMKGRGKNDREYMSLYFKPRTGCRLDWESEGITRRSMKITTKDADTLLKNTKMILNELKIDFLLDNWLTWKEIEKVDKDLKKFHETMKSQLENIGHLLETKSVFLQVHNPSEAAELLKFIDPNSLETISIRTRILNGKAVKMNFSELEALEHWKNAAELKINGNYILSPVESFSSFKKITLRVDVIRIGKLNEVKEFFFHSPKIQTFIIEILRLKEMKDQLISYFNQIDSNNEELGNFPVYYDNIDWNTYMGQKTWKWVKDVPGSTEKLLIILNIGPKTNVTFAKCCLFCPNIYTKFR